MATDVYPFDSFQRHKDLDATLCFILSPLRPEFRGPRDAIQEAASDFNLRCERADDIKGAGVIHANIWDHIQRAAVIVADITDFSPNVMFELGVATAIKENFRVVLLLREDAADNVPFDLGPFRHIRYKDTMSGAVDLRKRLYEAFELALSEGNIIASVAGRMQEWEKTERHFSLLPYKETLVRLRTFSGIGEAEPQILGYLLAAAIQHGVELDWWVKLNVANRAAAEYATELLLGPWVRPQFRAAYALQSFSTDLKSKATAEARRLSASPLVHKLLDAIEEGRVVDFTLQESSGLINEGERHELLQNFSRRVRVILPST